MSKITARELVNCLRLQHQVFLGNHTARRRLYEVNLHARTPLRVPALRRGIRGRCLAWAREHLLWNNEQWARVCFRKNLASVFILIPEEYKFGEFLDSEADSYIHTGSSSYQGGTMMVWAGIRLGGRTDLIWIRGTLNTVKYRNDHLVAVPACCDSVSTTNG